VSYLLRAVDTHLPLPSCAFSCSRHDATGCSCSPALPAAIGIAPQAIVQCLGLLGTGNTTFVGVFIHTSSTIVWVIARVYGFPPRRFPDSKGPAKEKTCAGGGTLKPGSKRLSRRTIMRQEEGLTRRGDPSRSHARPLPLNSRNRSRASARQSLDNRL
jgi:hypothetical protein